MECVTCCISKLAKLLVEEAENLVALTPLFIKNNNK